MRLLNYAIIRFALYLIIGIIIGYNFPVDYIVSLIIGFGFLLLLVISYFISKKQLQRTVWFGCIAALTTIAIGVLTVNLHNQKLFKNHYTKHIIQNTEYTIVVKVREVLKHNNYYEKYIVDVLKINDSSVSGKLMLNIKKDSLQQPLTVDDILMTTSAISDVPPPLNLYQFDYKNYLEKQYVYHQVFASHSLILLIDNKDHTMFGYADTFRNTINHNLKRYNFGYDEQAIITALILGYRQDISSTIFESYSKSGAVHILSVSGLHVGLILLLMQRLFKPIDYIKHGKVIKICLIVFLLWVFAIIAGLSPSVTRAAAMFSVVAIGMNLKRPSNIFNTLAISLFVILLFKPLFLFDIGFQMSYLAVISIVVIQPMFLKLWRPKNRIVDFFWQILAVSIAAQSGVIPVSFYYFHQFPGLFWLTNLIIIPPMGFILGFGILVMLLALFNILPQWMASFYDKVIELMNMVIAWVARQEQFIIHDIEFSFLQAVTSYILLIALIAILKKMSFLRLCFVLCSIIVFQLVIIFEKQAHQTEELVVFQKNRFTMIGHKTRLGLALYHNMDSTTRKRDNAIKDYKVGNNISSITEDSINAVYQIGNKRLLVIDSFGIYRIKQFKPDYVLLINSPKINIERMIDSLQPEMIIADGSNYKSYIERWKATCIKRKRPFHQTNEKGAFVIK